MHHAAADGHHRLVFMSVLASAHAKGHINYNAHVTISYVDAAMSRCDEVWPWSVVTRRAGPDRI